MNNLIQNAKNSEDEKLNKPKKKKKQTNRSMEITNQTINQTANIMDTSRISNLNPSHSKNRLISSKYENEFGELLRNNSNNRVMFSKNENENELNELLCNNSNNRSKNEAEIRELMRNNSSHKNIIFIQPNNHINNQISHYNPHINAHNNYDTNEIQVNINSEIKQLELLKNKIKELESKIGEINNDNKERLIIDSLKDFRNRNNKNY